MLDVNVYDTLACGVKNRSNLVWDPGASVVVNVCDETMRPFPSTMFSVTLMSTGMVLRLLAWYLKSSCEGKNGCDLKVIASTVGATCTVTTWLAVAVEPVLSVTVRVAVKFPVAMYWWTGLQPVWGAVPSPKVHKHVYGDTPPLITATKVVLPTRVLVGPKSAVSCCATFDTVTM